MLTLEKIASEFFKTNLELQITPQEEVKLLMKLKCVGYAMNLLIHLLKLLPKALEALCVLCVKLETMINLLDTTEGQSILNVI